MTSHPIFETLRPALAARNHLIDSEHQAAFRLFSGFYEGHPNLVVESFGKTLVLFDYDSPASPTLPPFEQLQTFLLEILPRVDCVIHKQRSVPELALRRGSITFGELPAQKITENKIEYALDLLMNQDACFYLDTRHLREWLHQNASGWRVLNTFAYTGSLGIAALAGGADQVIQTDRNKKFLSLARQSGMLNRLDIGKMKLRSADFFSEVGQLKHRGELFDCVIVDPPFFSTTPKGSVDLVNESVRVINKVRPLIRDGGRLVSINNALFLSGQDYIQSLENLCEDGYLSIEQLIPIPQDITGYPETIVSFPPTNPAPFNHATKIAILRVKRK